MAAKRIILWTCTTGGDWQWLSQGPSKVSFRSTNDNVRQGKIVLPPNPNYWHLCAKLVLQNVAYGDVFLRYFQENGVDKIQAMTVAQGKWQAQGTVDTNYSEASRGGITLRVELFGGNLSSADKWLIADV